MSKTFFALPLCAALVLPLALVAPAAVLAQADTTATDQTEATEQPGATDQTDATQPSTDEAAQAENDGETIAPAPDLSLGEDADQDSELGQPYFADTDGAWRQRCIKTDQETDPCQMYQLLEDAQGAPVAEFSLFRLPEGNQAAAGATVVVPLETSLQQQLTIRVDGGSARRYPFAFCNPIGCFARVGFTAQDVAAFKRGREAILSIVPALAPDQKVELTLSLNGFTASYDKSSVLEQ